MVAKSYQNLEQVGEPFTISGRQYVQVRTKAGTLKQVRFYTTSEYQKIYPNEPIAATYNVKQALGFTNGFITIFKGNTYEDREWFKASNARYHTYWGWYFTSEEELPTDIPSDVAPIKLTWESISDAELGILLPQSTINKVLENLLYTDEDPSQFVGTVGERIPLLLKVEKVIPHESNYGISNIHTMRDNNSNVFIWATSARCLSVGSYYKMTGQIKKHQTYHNVKQTWLTRCLSIEEIKNV